MKRAFIIFAFAALLLSGCAYIEQYKDTGKEWLEKGKELLKSFDTKKDDKQDGKGNGGDSGTVVKPVGSSSGASVKPSENTGKEYPPYGVIYLLENGDEAKRLAYENNRPLLVIVGEKTCSMCRALAERAVETDEFRKYLSDSKIVCIKIWDGLYSVTGRAKIRSKYSRQYPDINGEPWLFMAKVTSGDLLGAKAENFYPDQLEIVTVDATGNIWCGSYSTFNRITGVETAKSYTEWNADRLVKEIKATFPNSGWKN